MKKSVRSAALQMVLLLSLAHAGWTDSHWTGPGSDLNNGSNWSAGVPTDNGIFDAAAPQSISLSGSLGISSMTFHAGSAAYQFTIPKTIALDFNSMNYTAAIGILNSSSETQTFIVNDGATMTLHGADITGHVNIENSGTLALNLGCVLICFGSDAGTSQITNHGLLSVTGGSSAGNASIVNDGIIRLSLDSAVNIFGMPLSSSSGTLGNAAVVNNGLIDASQSTSDWSVGSISGAGNIELGSHLVTIGGNDQDSTISGVITGSGGLDKTGLGTLALEGNNTYSGGTQILSGEMRVTGSLASNVQVFTGATLSGNGSVREIANSGTVSPGVDGIGTMTATVYSGTGTLHIQLSGSSVSQLNVVGTADITGGTMTVTGSTITLGQYSVLKSSRLQGTFGTVNLPDSLFLISPLYTTTDVLLRITLATAFSPLAQTSNQQRLAANLDEFKNTTSAYTQALTSLAVLPHAQIPDALDQISGDALASFQNVNFQNAAAFSQGMHSRAVQVSSGSYGIWAQAMGWSETTDSDATLGSPKTRATTGGFQAGYDTSVADGMILGMSGGYGQTDVNVFDRQSSGDITSVHFGLYGAFAQNGWQTNVGTAMTLAANHMVRTVQYNGFDGQSASRFPTRLLSSFLESQYTFQPQSSFFVTPSASLRRIEQSEDAFAESGGSGLDLTVDRRTTQSMISSLGLSLHYAFGPPSDRRGLVTLTTAWEHELSALDNTLSVGFVETDSGTRYVIQGTPRNRNAAAFGLDGEVPLTTYWRLFAHYAANVSATSTTQSILGGARWTW